MGADLRSALGKRTVEPHPPHSMPLVMIGTGILRFGWFGSHAGSAAASNGQTAQAFLNTFIAAAAAGLAWVLVEWIRNGHPTNLGAASGIVAGLVATKPAAGFVSGPGPMAIGAIAGVVCCDATIGVRVAQRDGVPLGRHRLIGANMRAGVEQPVDQSSDQSSEHSSERRSAP